MYYNKVELRWRYILVRDRKWLFFFDSFVGFYFFKFRNLFENEI